MVFALRASLIGALFMLLPAAPAAASVDATFLGAQSHLPKTIYPELYDLRLVPNLAFRTLDGIAQIRLRFTAPSATVAFYAKDLQMSSLRIDGINPREDRIFDSVRGLHRLRFARTFSEGVHTLNIRYSGRLQSGLTFGMYVAHSKDGASFATQMEPTDARRVFPGWDEPIFKARFHIRVVVPTNFTAVSNMPVERSVPAGTFSKEVRFQTTPPMSTYLVAVCGGHYLHKSVWVNKTKITIYTMPSRLWAADEALVAAAESIRYFERYLGIRYMMPKLDIVAVPRFGSAMENWGAIVGGESEILLDPARPLAGQRRQINEVVSHEIAHQWTGDLVTHAAWNDLWLTEGFAQWLQERMERELHPAWSADLGKIGNRDFMLWRDKGDGAIRETGSNRWTVSFTQTQYEKAANLIFLIERLLGPPQFRAGLHAYLLSHAYRNALTDDFLRSLERFSRRKLGAVANPWLYQRGIPKLAVDITCASGRQRTRFRQDPSKWWPLLLADGTIVDRPIFEKIAPCGAFPNAASVNSYFRVKYEPAALSLLTKQFRSLPVSERDIAADDLLGWGAKHPVGAHYLALAAQLTAQDDLWTTRGALFAVTDLEDVTAHTPLHSQACAYVRARFSSLGYDLLRLPDNGASNNVRAQVLYILSLAGDGRIVQYARNRVQTGQAFEHRGAGADALGYATAYAIGVHASAEEHATFLRRARTDFRRADFWYSAYFSESDPAFVPEELAVIDSLPGGFGAKGLYFWRIRATDPKAYWHYIATHVTDKNEMYERPSDIIAELAPFSDDATIRTTLLKWFDPKQILDVSRSAAAARSAGERARREAQEFLSSAFR